MWGLRAIILAVIGAWCLFFAALIGLISAADLNNESAEGRRRKRGEGKR